MIFPILVTFAGCSTWPGPFFDDSIQETPHKKICLLGDTGKNSGPQKAVARALKQEKCHEIFFLGDLIYPDGIESADDSLFEDRFLKYYYQLSKEDNKPELNILLGNHDYNSSTEAWLQLAQEYPKLHFPSLYYVKRVEDICFVALDSNLFRFVHHQDLKQAQSEWLDRIYPSLNNCAHKVVLAHNPYKSPGPNYGYAKEELKKFYEAKVIGRFDYFFAGHEHIVKAVGTLKGTHMFISGAGGALAEDHIPGYITLEKSAPEIKTLSVKLKRIESDGKVSTEIFSEN